MSKFRFHILGLVHLPTNENYMGCAFTQKNVKLCRILMDQGHEVYLYGAENSNAPCTEFIQTHTLEDIREAWGEGDNRFEIGYNWKEKQFKHDFNDPEKKQATKKFYANATIEINKRKKPSDFLVITQGVYQRPVDLGVNLFLTVENSIGYRGSYAQFRSWESSYIQNFTYGSENPRECINGRYYDRVIPNYFDTKDFYVSETKDDYFLYMGRLIIRKGLTTAIKACMYSGNRLIVAGQPSEEMSADYLKQFPFVEYVGYADAKKRAELMSKAQAVFTPSIYLEPFCGVHVESMLCGTPVITTNFGAFTDYVIDGINGFKCDTLNDFVEATVKVKSLDSKIVRQSAERFTLQEIAKLYEKWFSDLMQLYLSTLDQNVKGWHYVKPLN